MQKRGKGRAFFLQFEAELSQLILTARLLTGSDMTRKLNKTYQDLLDAAEAEIETMTAAQALSLIGDEGHILIDIRETDELESAGRIPGALHVSRGMLEFVICPTSPFHNKIFSRNKKFVFFCAGGWRSALAAQQMQAMGLEPVAHIAGGFDAWVSAGGAFVKPG